MSHTVALIGVPSSLGAFQPGTEAGPAALRGAGLIARLEAAGQQVVDFGDVPVPSRRTRAGTGLSYLARLEAVARWVGKHAWRAHAEQLTPLVVGGDQASVIGSVAASAQSVPGVGLVWIDSRPDFETPETSPSDLMSRMVLAMVAGQGPKPLVRLLGFAPIVHPQRIVVIGARTITAGERRNLREAGVRVFELDDVERLGAQACAVEAVAHLERQQARAVHLSVDLSVLDPSLWPGTSTPEPGGLRADELAQALRTIAERLPVAAMDLMELVPGEDPSGATTEAALLAVEAALCRPGAVQPRPGRPPVRAA